MSAVQPVAVYAMRIPPGDILVPAVPEFAAMFRVTMAAIDPSEETEDSVVADKKVQRATLKVIRVADDMVDELDSDEDYDLGSDESDEGSDEEVNGGPSTKRAKKVKGLTAAGQDVDMASDSEDDEDEDDAAAAPDLQKLLKNARGKGKGLAGPDDDEDDDSEDDEEDALELDEIVLCTLDANQHFQQPLDFVVGEGEKVFFKVSGSHTIHLTGNYVMPLDDSGPDDDDYDDDEVDLSPDEDELDDEELAELDALVNGDAESDDLDDLADPRITELGEDETEGKASAPAAKDSKKAKGKGKNKRPAEESEDDATLDDLVAKSMGKDEQKSQAGKADKKSKKQKKNDGQAVTPEVKKDAQPNGSGSEKKVQFSKDLVQGPTPSATPPTSNKAKKADGKSATSKASLGTRTVQGVILDDRALGSGPAAKKGSRLDMRYIGKLESGKVFDSNKSGKPFSFKVGAGEVIKGWDIGLEGMAAGGERRITIPAHLAYGNKALPGIPKNSKLIFDVRCLAVK